VTDRELLESAARAGGYTVEYDKIDGRWAIQDRPGLARDLWKRWSPLHDDGDAFRLAVKLNLQITIEDERCGCVTASWGDDYDNHAVAHSETPETAAAATRRAIVQAAAKIGKKIDAPLVRAD
jgi:hypothetical protein